MKTWPNTPRALAGRLRRAATFLRKIGVEISFEREGQARTRIISITTAQSQLVPEQAGARPSAPSASSAPVPNTTPANGFAAHDRRTVALDADGRDGKMAHTVRATPLKPNCATEADGTDADFPPRSAPEKAGWSTRL